MKDVFHGCRAWNWIDEWAGIKGGDSGRASMPPETASRGPWGSLPASRSVWLSALMGAVLCGLVSACSPTGMVLGLGAMAGTAATQERGFSTAIDDARIRLEINKLWAENESEFLLRLGLTIHEGRVLLTGILPNARLRALAVRLAWQPEGVREVINEVEVGEGGGLVGMATDSWIATQLKTSNLFDGGVLSVNYSVEVVNGVVYLLGIAQDADEHHRVVTHARSIDNVRKVVSYVRIKSGQGQS